MLDSSLYKSIENATKVSDKRKSAFERLGVKSIYDLVTYYPYRYVDMSNPVKISHAQIGQKQSLIGRINKAEVKEPKPKMRLLEVSIVDDSGIIIATWFNQPWLDRMITAGATIAIFGMVKFDYGYKRITPEHFEVFDADSGVDAYKGVIPVYRTNSDISNKWIRSIISSELDSFANLDDNLPAFVREKYRLMSKKHALRYVHFAPSSDLCEQAKRRLAFEEALKLQIYLMNNSLQNSQMRSSIASSFPKFDTMVKALPFTLTDDQNAALAEIKADMCSSDYMKRLVLGDVGCGKTVLAALALALCCDSGKQCVVMAPTVLLVFQYREKLAELLNAAGISFACLTGSTSADERKQILAGLKSGKIHCVFGTHALLSENVEFKDLGLVVIDEQHRFGVEQREKLLRKNSSCDYLMLSATPIPRSLALCIYGDMQISFLKSRPNKDLKITCQIVDNNMKFKAFDKIRNEVDAGHQAFIVCPLVGIKKTNANVDMQNLILNGQSICDYRSAIDNCKYLQTQIFPE
ncbi:MAG: DEAD/DEAH box helicase, partial [Coriobacteriales bacterium]|nr:DEAD/DEAH box helicase [Coriobacteriales bacterium]